MREPTHGNYGTELVHSCITSLIVPHYTREYLKHLMLPITPRKVAGAESGLIGTFRFRPGKASHGMAPPIAALPSILQESRLGHGLPHHGRPMM